MSSRALWATSVCLLLLLAAVFFIAGTLVMTVGMNKMKEEVLKKIWLGVEANGSYTQTTLDWIDPKYEMLFKVHVFSVVNADEFRAKPNSTPMLVEKGPYTFCERQHKEVVGLRADGTRIFYRNFKWYTFDQSRSCVDCFLSDVVVVPNFVLQEVWQKVKDNFLFQLGVDAAIQKTNTTAFLKMTVAQLLFEGQSNPLLVELCKMDPTTCKDRPTIISLFRDQNGTDDGVYEVGTGINGAADISRVYSWNGRTETSAWYKPTARRVCGVDGQFFRPNFYRNFAERTWTSALRQWPPFLRAGPPVDIFTGRMQRIIRMEEGWTKTIEGITALTLHPSPEMNDVGVQMDEGFCNANGTRFFRDPRIQQPGCAPAGLMDISSVIDAPFLVGRPHFGGSPAAVRTAVGGVREAKNEEDTRLYVEMFSGVVVRAVQMYQLNVAVINAKLGPMVGLKKLIVPLVWINDSANVDPQTAAQLRAAQKTASTLFFLAIGLFAAMCVVLAILLILLLVFLVRCCLRSCPVPVRVVNTPLSVLSPTKTTEEATES